MGNLTKEIWALGQAADKGRTINCCCRPSIAHLCAVQVCAESTVPHLIHIGMATLQIPFRWQLVDEVAQLQWKLCERLGRPPLGRGCRWGLKVGCPRRAIRTPSQWAGMWPWGRAPAWNRPTQQDSLELFKDSCHMLCFLNTPYCDRTEGRLGHNATACSTEVWKSVNYTCNNRRQNGRISVSTLAVGLTIMVKSFR